MSRRPGNFIEDFFSDWREWFGPKTYGVGIEPKSWKGWAALIVVLMAVIFVSVFSQMLLR